MLRVSVLSLLSNALKTVSTFVLGKVMAVFAGPVGLLWVGQLNNFITLLYSFASLGLNNAVVKKTAELGVKNDVLKPYLSTSYLLMLASSAFIVIPLLLFNQKISIWVIGDAGYYWVFIIIALGLPFYVTGQFILSLYNGAMDYKKVIISNMFINVLVLINAVTLVYFYHETGAILAVSLNLFIYFIVPVFNKGFLFKEYFLLLFESRTLRSLFSFSLMFIVNSVALPVSQILQRKYLAGSHGLEYAGLWEALNRLSSILNLFLSSTLALYYLPKLSSLHEPKLISNEINRMAQYLLPLSVMILFVIYFFSDIILALMFDKQFVQLSPVIAWQLPGDFMRISSALFAYVLISKERTLVYVIGEVVAAGFWLLLTVLLVPQLGLKGAALAYSVTYFIYLLWVFFGYRLMKS